MSETADLLFAFLREVFYASPNAKLDIEKIDEDYVEFAKGLAYFAHCFSQYNEFAKALAKGDLSVPPPPPENELAAPLKTLHASLKHLTWQSQQVAKGDYRQHVDFMGDFSDGFNKMVAQLADRQENLENEILQSQKHTKALEQSNLLLSNLTQHIPQQIFVVDTLTREALLFNDTARKEFENNLGYINILMDALPDECSMLDAFTVDVHYSHENVERYLAINAYLIEWYGVNAVALVVSDVTSEKRQIKELEDRAYRDSLTNLYNRFYGMLILNDWLALKKRFTLVFVDLDNLKYINDVHGHGEGDEYILRASKHLLSFSPDAIVCRLGGDEFMLLLPDYCDITAASRIEEISKAIEFDEYLRGKKFHYSISTGIVYVDERNELPPSSLLSLADERMYEQKRARKKERLTQAPD